MQYRRFGRTGEDVSVISLGAEHFVGIETQDVVTVIRKAIDAGINYMDLICGEPEVRDSYGASLADGYRDRVMISGHFGAARKDGQYFKTRDPRISEEYFHDLLRRLDTDYVDVLMLHYVDDPAELEQMMGPTGAINQARRLQEEGKARFIGLSSHDASTALAAVQTGCLDVLMFPVNPAFDTLPDDVVLDAMWKPDPYQDSQSAGVCPLRRELQHSCLEHDTAVIAMKPYAGGWLFWKENPSGVVLSPLQCLSYALSQLAVATVLPGCKTVEQLDAALAFADASDEDLDYSSVHNSARWALNSTCMYCNHCLPCSEAIDIGRITKLSDSFRVSRSDCVRQEYMSLDAHASDCTKCGSCLQRCPFGVDVVSSMERAVEVFGI